MALLPNIGPLELVIVLVIAVLILGPKRIPEAAKSVGEGMRNFKHSLSGDSDDEKSKSEIDEKAKAKAKTEA